MPLCVFLGGVLLLIGFCSPYWLQSWSDTHSPFINMGLWEYCFYKMRCIRLMCLKPEFGPTLKTFTSYDGPIQSMNFKIYCATVDYSWTNSSSKKIVAPGKIYGKIHLFLFIIHTHFPFSHTLHL